MRSYGDLASLRPDGIRFGLGSRANLLKIGKSTEYNLDFEFNSLDSWLDICEAHFTNHAPMAILDEATSHSTC
jgi:hypothetical protein